MRPSFDDYFLGIAEAVAKRADCTRRLAGAVIVDKYQRIVSTGYNGAPAGKPGCLTAGACPRGRAEAVEPLSSYDTGAGACIAVHAEANALLHGDATRYRGGVLYVVSLTFGAGRNGYYCPQMGENVAFHDAQQPCAGCARLIEGAGISRVVVPF